MVEQEHYIPNKVPSNFFSLGGVKGQSWKNLSTFNNGIAVNLNLMPDE